MATDTNTSAVQAAERDPSQDRKPDDIVAPKKWQLGLELIKDILDQWPSSCEQPTLGGVAAVMHEIRQL